MNLLRILALLFSCNLLFSSSLNYKNSLKNDVLNNINTIEKLTKNEKNKLLADIQNKNKIYQYNYNNLDKNVSVIIPMSVFIKKAKGANIIYKDFFVTNNFIQGAKKIILSSHTFRNNKQISDQQLFFILKNIYYKNMLNKICSQQYHKRILYSNYKYLYRFITLYKNKKKIIFSFLIDKKKCTKKDLR